jgi:hypothetical protein
MSFFAGLQTGPKAIATVNQTLSAMKSRGELRDLNRLFKEARAAV